MRTARATSSTLHTVRTALKQNVRGLAKDADAGPQHQQADGEAEQRIDPAHASRADDDGADDDGDVGEGVAEIVDEDAAQVEVAAAAHQREVMPPLTASAAREVQIIQLSTTLTGERKRSMDS